jgi:hypothetical protein
MTWLTAGSAALIGDGLVNVGDAIAAIAQPAFCNTLRRVTPADFIAYRLFPISFTLLRV